VSERVVMEVPDAVIERVAARAAEIVLAELRDGDRQGRWIVGAAAAAEHMGCSVKRVYNRLHLIPHERDGRRLVFRTDDLDRYLRQ
jgi:hypothetical protein